MNIKQIINLGGTPPAEKAVLMEENKVFDSVLSEDEMQSLTVYFVNLPYRLALELWNVMGNGAVENTVALHQAKVNGRSVSAHLFELLTSDTHAADREAEAAEAAAEAKRQSKLGAERRIRMMNTRIEAVEAFKQMFGSRKDGLPIYLDIDTFLTKEEAAQAYDLAVVEKREIVNPEQQLNFPEKLEEYKALLTTKSKGEDKKYKKQ